LPGHAFVSRGIPVEGSKIEAVASVKGGIPVLISRIRASTAIDLSIFVSVKTLQSFAGQALTSRLTRSSAGLPWRALICCRVPEELVRK